MEVTVRSLLNKPIAMFSAALHDKVSSVMTKIESASKVPISHQRLLMCGVHEEIDSSNGEPTMAELLERKVHAPFRNGRDFWPKTRPACTENAGVSLIFVVVDGVGSGRVISMEAVLTTTIQDIVQYMSDQHSQEEWDAVSFFLGDYGKSPYFPRNEMFCEGLAHHEWQQAIGDFFCAHKAIPVSFKNFGWKKKNGAKKVTFIVEVNFENKLDLSEMQNVLVIKTLTSKHILVQNVFLGDKVSTVKQKIECKEGIPVNQQRLVWRQYNLEDDNILSDYEISDKSVLHLILRLRGGGCGAGFVDVTKDRLVEQPWAKSGPDWRACTGGLSIQGLCKNKGCAAYQQMVIVNIGMNNFDLIIDAADCKCPMCKQKVAPIKPGFNNCYWRIAAVKTGTENALYETDWRRTGNIYCSYDEHACGSAEFKRLQIFVLRLRSEMGHVDRLANIKGPIPRSCAICFDSMGQSDRSCVIQLPCSHIFHEGCTKKWARVLRKQEYPPTCPICRSSYAGFLC